MLSKIVGYPDLEEFNTSSIDMGDVGNMTLPKEYYDVSKFQFTDTYLDFLSYIMGSVEFSKFDYNFPVVNPH